MGSTAGGHLDKASPRHPERISVPRSKACRRERRCAGLTPPDATDEGPKALEVTPASATPRPSPPSSSRRRSAAVRPGRRRGQLGVRVCNGATSGRLLVLSKPGYPASRAGEPIMLSKRARWKASGFHAGTAAATTARSHAAAARQRSRHRRRPARLPASPYAPPPHRLAEQGLPQRHRQSSARATESRCSVEEAGISRSRCSASRARSAPV